MNSYTTKVTVILTAIVVLAAGFLLINESEKIDLPASIQAVAINPPVAMTDFTLYDYDKSHLNLSDFTGQWSFVFFGYTNCPDICPATISQLVLVNRQIQRDSNNVIQPNIYLVSVDPDRDTPEVLGKYIHYFDKSFKAITGSHDELIKFEKQFNVFHRYGNKDRHGNYSVEHSAETFLINPAGKIVARFLPPMNIRQVAEQYVSIVDYYEGAKS